MVAKFFQRLNDFASAIQFLVLSRCVDEAFQVYWYTAFPIQFLVLSRCVDEAFQVY
jgi:hypothetical protein